jgi:hypothetical protein
MSDTLINILLGILTVLSAAMFANNLHADKKMWDKLDRITNLMMKERDLMREDLLQVRNTTMCNDRDLAEIKGRMKARHEMENHT